MPTLTTNYELQKPLVNNATDQDLWGGYLNDDMDDIDTLLRSGITVETVASQTSGFTADASISVKKLYPCDATGGIFNVTIPLAATAENGATVFIKKTDSSANVISILRSGSDTLDGDTSLSLSSESDTYGLVSDGVSAWNSICKPSPAVVIPDASTTVKGIVELATAAETLAGVDTTRAITADGFAGNKSLSTNGYYKLPGGLILQWGFDGGGGPIRSISFPIAFSTACYSVNANANLNQRDVGITAVSTSSFSVVQSNAGTPLYWQAIGV